VAHVCHRLITCCALLYSHTTRRPDEGKTIFIPQHRPFARCRDVSSYQRLEKVGQGTFG
jgi:hypothetical protein